MSDEEFFDLQNSTKEFKTFINEYKRQRELSELSSNINILKILELKKLQAEQKETEEEYIKQELKKNIQFNEEMKSLFGIKAMNHHSIREVKSVRNRVENMNKMKKERFLQGNLSYSRKVNKNQKYIKTESNIINLPYIYPEKKKEEEAKTKLNNIRSQKSEKTNFHWYSKLKGSMNRKRNYLLRLDILRDRYLQMSMEIGERNLQSKSNYDNANKMFRMAKKKMLNS